MKSLGIEFFHASRIRQQLSPLFFKTTGSSEDHHRRRASWVTRPPPLGTISPRSPDHHRRASGHLSPFRPAVQQSPPATGGRRWHHAGISGVSGHTSATATGAGGSASSPRGQEEGAATARPAPLTGLHENSLTGRDKQLPATRPAADTRWDASCHLCHHHSTATAPGHRHRRRRRRRR